MLDLFHDPQSVSFLLLAALCVLLFGIDKSGFGGGIGTLAVPLMTLSVSAPVAAGLMLPLMCACDLAALWSYRRREYNKADLRILLPGALLGIGLGSLLIGHLIAHRDLASQALADRFLKMAIGAISILFVCWQVGRGWLLTHLPPKRPGHWSGSLYGLFAGFASTLAHAGGPPAVMYLLPQKLDRREFVGTTVWFFATLNFIKLIPYAKLGMLDLSNLKTSLLLMPMVPLGIWLGHLCNRRLSQAWFMRVILVILFLTGLQLLLGKNVADLARWMV
jgi:uncharacterized membrane protein YfcA